MRTPCVLQPKNWPQKAKTLAIQCDVADDAQVEAMVDQTVATFGRLDAAYNNAGVIS